MSAPILELLHAAGARLRYEYPGGFAILSDFRTIGDQGVVRVTGDAALQRRLSEAVREGAQAAYLDTLATHDRARLRMMPDSARYYFALAGVPQVAIDSAKIEVFSGEALKEPGPTSMNIMRYVFVFRERLWHFVRRELVYAT